MAVNRVTNPDQLQIRVLKQGQIPLTKDAGEDQENDTSITTPSGANFFVDVYVIFNGGRRPMPHYEIDSSGVVTQDFYTLVNEGFLTIVFNVYTPALIAAALTYTFEYVMYEILVA